MRKSYKYRIYPTRAQVTKLEATIDVCAELYNAALQERREAYRLERKSIGYLDQQNQLPEIKSIREDFALVHSQVLQDVLRRLDKAFQAFFRRVKSGEQAGFPRFRARHRYNSFTYPQSGFRVEGHHLKLSRIGNIHIKLHRPIEGAIKTCCVRREPTGKWYVSFSCETPQPEPLPESGAQVGIDVGLETFAYLSTGERLDNPRFFRHEEKSLAQAGRNLSKQEKGTPERAKRRKVVSRVHERIKFKRHNFTHQEACKIVNRFGVITVEDVHVKRMVHNRCLSKSIMDAAWSGFADCLLFKAENAGRKYAAINPAYTSQDCSRCAHREKMPLACRVYKCPCCHLEINRDLNASLNILRHGLVSLGIQSVEAASNRFGLVAE